MAVFTQSVGLFTKSLFMPHIKRYHMFNPFLAIRSSYGIHREVFPISQKDVTGRPARIRTVHATHQTLPHV